MSGDPTRPVLQGTTQTTAGISPAKPADAAFVPPFCEGDLLLDKYRIESLIGTGGIGFVMSAVNVGLDERVALKFLRPEFVSNAEAVRRFTTEARLASKIQNPHVARVLDIESLPGTGPFIVMDLLVGRDLNQVLHEDGPLQLEQAVNYVMQACEALAAAHARNIVHRDVKPDNLFLTRQPHGPDIIKILDFGISKLQLGCVHDDRNSPLIRTATALGSPSYMSPEQMRADANIDARADVWSLGCVLYELLAGQHAFDAPTLMQVCARVLEREPPPIQVRVPGVPPAIEQVISRCLEKDPARRYADVAELARALSPFASASMQSAVERCSEILGNMTIPALEVLEVSPAPAASADAPEFELMDAVDDSPAEIVLAKALSGDNGPVSGGGPVSTIPLSTAPVAIELHARLSPEPVIARAAPRRSRDWLSYVSLAAALTALVVPALRKQAGVAQQPTPPLGALTATQPLTLTATLGAVSTTPPSLASETSDPGAASDATEAANATITPKAKRAVLASPPAPAAATGAAASSGAAANAEAGEAAPESALETPLASTSETDAGSDGKPMPVAEIAPAANTLAVAAVRAPAAPKAILNPPNDNRLSVNAVAAVVRAHASEVRACFELAQLDPDDLRGKVSVIATLDAEGNVVHARMPTLSEGGPRLSACMVAAAKRWKFPGRPGAPALTSYTLVFE